MPNQKFSFPDATLNIANTRKHRRKKVFQATPAKPSFDTSVENDIYEEGTGSLTYSSSSQAGESTDSSISEMDSEAEQKVFQQQTSQRVEMHRKVSNTGDSLNYSEDDESSIYRQQIRDTTGQCSDSYGHDSGGYRIDSKLNSPPTSINKISRSLSRMGGKNTSKKQAFSPTTTLVTSDVSLSSAGTPSSPPPRYRPASSDQATEVWYAKWWMCGFTDALNINSNY